MLQTLGRAQTSSYDAGGRISSYDETWALSAGEALLQLLTPAAQEVEEIVEPEFWPGRLAGWAPAPKVRAPLVNPPTVVVLPGFGNDKADYATPLGLPEETGLAAALGRRGFRVEVVPVARGDWLQVLTRGGRDPDFLLFEKARRTSPAFRWYADKVSETLGKVDGPVLLVGHSAGGWLAKLACLLDGAVAVCVEINQCVGCTRQFFTKSFLGDDAAVLARSSGEEPASPRHRAGIASTAWRTTR